MLQLCDFILFHWLFATDLNRSTFKYYYHKCFLLACVHSLFTSTPCTHSSLRRWVTLTSFQIRPWFYSFIQQMVNFFLVALFLNFGFDSSSQSNLFKMYVSYRECHLSLCVFDTNYCIFGKFFCTSVRTVQTVLW